MRWPARTHSRTASRRASHGPSGRPAHCFARLSVAAVICGASVALAPAQERDDAIDADELCAAVSLDATGAQPLDRIDLGLPSEDNGANFGAVIVRSEGDDPFVVPLLDAGDGRAELVVPPHPSMALGGGEVTFSFVAALAETANVRSEAGTAIGSGDGTLTCEPVAFRILPLPPAPDAVDTMRASMDDLFVALGRFDRIADQPTGVADAVSETVRAALDEVLDETPDGETLTSEQVTMRDALLARVDVAGMVARQANVVGKIADRAEETNGEIGPGVPRSFLRRIQISAPLAIACPSDMPTLQQMMRDQRDAEHAIYATNAVAAPALTGLGFVPHPAAKAATGVGAVTLTAANAGLAFVQGTYPSAFEPRLLFSLSKTRFEEDDPTRGRVTSVTVRTISKGFDASGVIADIALQAAALKDVRLVRETAAKIETVGRISANASHVGGEAVNYAQDKLTGGFFKAATSNTLVVPPQHCSVTVTEDLPEWFEHEISAIYGPGGANGPAFKALEWQGGLAYFPLEVGYEFLNVTLRMSRERNFGYRATPSWGRKVEVKPIVVTIDPGGATVRAGDVVAMRADVRNALDTDVRWTVEPDGHTIVTTDDPNEVRIVTSEDEADFPIFVKAISTSKGGLRGAPDAVERSDVALLQLDSCKPQLTASAQCSPDGPSTIEATLGWGACERTEENVAWSVSSPAKLLASSMTGASSVVASEFDGTIEIDARIENTREQPDPVQVLVSCGCPEGPASDGDASQCKPGAPIINLPNSCISVCENDHLGVTIVELPKLTEATGVNAAPSRKDVETWFARVVAPGDTVIQAGGHIMVKWEDLAWAFDERILSFRVRSPLRTTGIGNHSIYWLDYGSDYACVKDPGVCPQSGVIRRLSASGNAAYITKNQR